MDLTGSRNFFSIAPVGGLDISRWCQPPGKNHKSPSAPAGAAESSPAMPSTHLSLHYHLVFSTKNRAPLITETWRGRLYAYLGGVVKSAGGVPEAIGGVSRTMSTCSSAFGRPP